MIFIRRNFQRGWNKDCQPEASETFAIYSKENSAACAVNKLLTEMSEDYCLLFRALGIPGVVDDIMSELGGKPVYMPYDAKKIYIKRFPQLIYQFKKEEISTVLNQWTSSFSERRFIYCVRKDSLDLVTAYFENTSYTELSEGSKLWDYLEFFVENIPEFEYDDSFFVTARPEYLPKITQIGKEYQFEENVI